MIEMNHAEVAEKLEYLSKELAYQPALWKQMTVIQAAADERRISNWELVEVVKCGKCINGFVENRCPGGMVLRCQIHDETMTETDFCSCGERKDGTK